MVSVLNAVDVEHEINSDSNHEETPYLLALMGQHVLSKIVFTVQEHMNANATHWLISKP